MKCAAACGCGWNQIALTSAAGRAIHSLTQKGDLIWNLGSLEFGLKWILATGGQSEY